MNTIVTTVPSVESVVSDLRECLREKIINSSADKFLFFINDDVLRNYEQQFEDYLPNDIELCSLNSSLSSLTKSVYGDSLPYTLRAYGRSNIGAITSDCVVIFRNKPFSNSLLFKEFAHTKLDMFTPVTYVKENSIACFDSCYNDFDFDDNVSFSYSVGWYNSEEYVVIDGELVDKDDVVELHNGCMCHRDSAIYIDYRDDYYHEDDCVIDVNDNYILRDDAVRVNGDYYHEESEDIFTCENCDETFHIDDYYEDGVCVSCGKSHQRVHGLMSYHTNVLEFWNLPSKADKKVGGKGVFCGFELEMQAIDDQVHKVSEFVSNFGGNFDSKFIFCQDGSLDDRLGFEAISAPLNMNDAKERAAWLVSNLCSDGKELVEKDVDGGHKYGLHVHISSHFLSTFDKTKIQNFCTIHEKFIRKVGKRGKTEYQTVKNIRKLADKKYGNDSRYQAVNIQNSATIEFRFPSSIVCEHHIGLNIELAYAITMFCAFSANVISQDQIEEFYKFVEKNRGEYPLLHKFILEMAAK